MDSVILFAIAIVHTARISKPIGYPMGLSGLAYIAQGWILGSVGFAQIIYVPQLLGYFLVVVWSIWFFIVALRMKESAEAAGADCGVAEPQPWVVTWLCLARP